jgi:uncharacterized protein YaaR (DUF327 family)
LKHPKPETGLKNTPTDGDTTQTCTTIEQDTSQTAEKIAQLKALTEAAMRERDQLANLMKGRDDRHAEQVADLVDKIERLENKLAKSKRLPNLTKLRKYKLHGRDVVRCNDLAELLTEHFGEV